MKKLFTSVALALALMSASAENYTCPLAINISGSVDMPAGDVTVSVTKQDNGKYTMDLKNFAMGDLGVGNIHIENVEATECGNVTALETQQTIQITQGDDASVEDWMGPRLGDLPILLKGQLKGGNFNAILNIPLAGGMIVGVKLGNDANQMGQLPNSGFEEFSEKSKEPIGWHSFYKGNLAGSLAGTAAGQRTWESEDKPESSEGTKSVMIKSSSIFSVSANGTITTGRIQAGAMTASNKKNCSFLDFSKTDLDVDNNPFYAVLTNKPDFIKMSVKYHVGERSAKDWSGKVETYSNYVTASAKAILTNGKYVQDPEVDDYNDNIIARAENKTIADTKDAWQEISIPFTYAKDKETPKAALVTISTCAEPGGGSKNSKDPDILYVDDVELVYNAGFKSVSFNNEELTDFDESGNINIEKYDKKVKPEDFTIVAEGAGAYVTKKITADDEATYVTITVTSNDLKTFVTRTVTFPGLVNGINKPQTVTLPNGINAIYNLAGQQVSSMTSGNVYIVKTTDGKTKKVIKK